MNLMIQPNQICLIVKLYNNRPELLPDSNVMEYEKDEDLTYLTFANHKKRKNVQFLLAYVDCFFDCNSKLRQAVAVVH